MKFTKDHEWVSLDGDIATVGISKHAADALGDVVFVEVPEIGKTVSKGDSFAVVESVKAASDVYAPVSGEVVEANDALSTAPETVNSAAEADGWFARIKVSDAAELDALMDQAAYDADLLPILGALRYRTSYGQNVLRHLVECAHIAGMMAAELGLDVETCKRAAFLHDIGKALTHESEGSHAMVGAELARRHGESPDIVHAIEAHHNEVEPTTVEAILTQAADAISGSRPGARRESLEAYVHRLERLEEIASSHEGVDRVFAMQAGREVRVMVSPDHLDDSDAHALAREIAHEIQSELTYPGQIRVTVVRESRATEIAH